jgi:hypothetical protein
MKLHLAQALLDVHADVDISRAIEIRVSDRRVATLSPDRCFDLGPDRATGAAGTRRAAPVQYRLPPAFGATLAGSGELSLHYSDTGAEIARAEVAADVAPQSGDLRFVDGSGHPVVLNKWGHRSITFGDASEAMIDGLFRHTRQVIAQITEFGLKPWLMGGTLLGAVRSGQLMAHDDDADLGYVSAHDNPVDAALESFALQRFLESAGHTVIRYSATQMQILFHTGPGAGFHVDVFGGFYRDGMFMQPFHVRAALPPEIFDDLQPISLAGWEFPAPNPPAPWLEANYGPGWRVPDTGHRFVTPASAASRYINWFGNLNQHLDFWDEHYEYDGDSLAGLGAPSALAVALLADAPADATLFDLGHGRGNDLLHLAGRGHRVVGVDYSRSAAAAASTRLGSDYPAVELHRLDLGDRRQTLALAMAETGADAPVRILSADLLHVLTIEARPALVTMVRHLLGPRGEWHVSFPTVMATRFSVDDPTTWHLTVEQFRRLVATEPDLRIVSVRVDPQAERHTATAIVVRKGPLL